MIPLFGRPTPRQCQSGMPDRLPSQRVSPAERIRIWTPIPIATGQIIPDNGRSTTNGQNHDTVTMTLPPRHNKLAILSEGRRNSVKTKIPANQTATRKAPCISIVPISENGPLTK